MHNGTLDAQMCIHIFIFLLIVSSAFYPIYILKKGVFLVPFIVSVSWIIFDGCIINRRLQNGRRQNDMHVLFQYFEWNVSESKAKFMIYSGMVLLPTIMLSRVLYA